MKRNHVYALGLTFALSNCFWYNYDSPGEPRECATAADCVATGACAVALCNAGRCVDEPLYDGDECTTAYGDVGRCKNDRCVSLATFYNVCDGPKKACVLHSECITASCKRYACVNGQCSYAPYLDGVQCVRDDNTVGECRSCECVK
jgi:hypothetical protein